MDPAGAAMLRERIEQQRQWQLATAVQKGHQARVDPDLSALRKIGDKERVYDDDDGPFAKRLVGESWVRFAIDEPTETL